ncbi:hypothetical protein [Xanthomonas arboricola]|uniref:hypothetical protein n=1 Tax=Xanthomonas arboricola TaxID=56448 RepID=UPI000CEEA3BE|nr:hypothetical protein [Xanthomonas arboricola]PPT55565.1 hypothetical protein XarbCFBP8153_19450 [Xanthomonas arboricola]QDS14270.1 hypothetical protein FPL04_00350 [Xanthomonas arboricola]
MKSSVTRLHQVLKRIAWCCALLTAAFAATAIEWQVFADKGPWWAAFITFGVTALIGAAPYAIYTAFIPASKAGPMLKSIVLCVLVALSVVPNAWWFATDASTNGWNFFIVPAFQVFYLLVVVPFIIVLMHALSRRCVRAPDA